MKSIYFSLSFKKGLKLKENSSNELIIRKICSRDSLFGVCLSVMAGYNAPGLLNFTLQNAATFRLAPPL